MKVKDCMCSAVCCVKSDEKLNEVARLMQDNHTGCIPVCDNNNRLVGLVTDRDVVLRAVACNKAINQIHVSEIMTCNVYTCKEDDEISEVQNQMSTNQIRRIPVCDDNNHVIGIITMGDLANQSSTLGKDAVCNTIEGICDCKTQAKNAE